MNGAIRTATTGTRASSAAPRCPSSCSTMFTHTDAHSATDTTTATVTDSVASNANAAASRVRKAAAVTT